ncbi:MAG: hypothetical protein RSG50_12080, partial [Clostridia bacterium]
KEKRDEAVALMKSIRGHNTYTQGGKRGRVFDTPGFGDCSSTVNAIMKRVLGYGIGSRTTNQIANTSKRKSVIVDLRINKAGVPDVSKLLPGDCLYFAGNDASRRSYKYVGHVEMVVAKNTLCGHGSGKGPTAKNLTRYCKARQRGKAPTRRGNRGLICVRRWIFDD